MKEPRYDDERLSELLDGRLEGPEREEILAYLATADEDYDVYAEASAILLEAEQEAAREARAGEAADPPQRPDTVPPSTKARGRWLRPGARRWLAIPAILAGLVVLGRLAPRAGTGLAGNPVHLATVLEGTGGLQIRETQPLPVQYRGAEDDEWTPGEAAAAGLYLMRLAVAIEAGDTVAIRRQVRQVKRFDPLGGSALDTIALLAGGPPAELNRLLQKETERLEENGSPDHLRVGAWIEAAQLATIGRDAAFFRTKETRAMLRRAEKLPDGDSSVRQAVAGVRGALPEGAPPSWEILPARLDGLFKAIAD